MAQTINTNIASIDTQRSLNSTQNALQTAMQRLSSGLRINSAKDDAAGLAISERMQAQINGMTQASQNATNGISLAQTADGALGTISGNLQRMRELAVEASNATSSGDLTSLNAEYQQLAQENTRVIGSTTFNGTALLSGSISMTFQVGANNSANDQITVSAAALSIGSIGDLTSQSDAQTAITNLDTALNSVNSLRATYGATENRFQAVVSNLSVATENASSARSQIVDADYATETANLSRAQILQQAGISMLAQANSSSQSVLKLLS